MLERRLFQIEYEKNDSIHYVLEQEHFLWLLTRVLFSIRSLVFLAISCAIFQSFVNDFS